MSTLPDPLSVVVLTKDEAAHLRECLDAVVAQLQPGDELIVLDAGSSDDSVAIAHAAARERPAQVRVEASNADLTLGAARNRAVQAARHDLIVFVSADAVPEAGWLDHLRAAASNADIVYGRQRHAPPDESVWTVSRGLRYHHFEKGEGLPERFASNVNAAYRRFAFESLRFDERLPGAEDVAFAKAARLAGSRLAYAPRAVVRHKDSATLKAEWRKVTREGEAYARARRVLGTPTGHIAWAVAVAGLCLIAAVSQESWMLAPTMLVFFAPAIRRILSPASRHYRPLPLAGAVAVSPFLDLAFLGSYLKRRVVRG